jgi:hypothetical protein
MTPDDHQWFEVLAGRPAQVHDAAALREAGLLREAIQRIEARAVIADASAAAELAEQAAQGQARLFDRLRHEGLLTTVAAGAGSSVGADMARPGPDASAKARPNPSPKVVPLRPPRWAWASLAAAAVAAGWLVMRPADLPPASQGGYDEPPALRGQVPLVTLRRPEPEAYAKRLQADLATAGAGLRIYRDKQGWVLDVDVPPERLEAATPVLNEAGIPAAAGLTRVVLTAGAP